MLSFFGVAEAVNAELLGGSRITVVQSGSESRLLQDQWGSEMLQIGASEWPWIGASETVAQGSSEVTTHIVEVSKGASETGSASGQVLTSAQALSGEGSRLKILLL